MLQTTTPDPSTLATAVPLFLTSNDFGQRIILAFSTQPTFKGERDQLERQAFTNAPVIQRVQRAGGWLAIDATQWHNQPVTPLVELLAPTVTETINDYGNFGTPVTERDVTAVLGQINSSQTFSVGRVQRRILVSQLAISNTPDADAFGRFMTELTLQVAWWCSRTTAERIRHARSLEGKVLMVALRIIQAQAAEGRYTRLVPGLLITNINNNGPTQDRRTNNSPLTGPTAAV
jgi:hypothetical protein